MKICRVCSAECADNMEFCPVCGAELLEGQEVQVSDSVIENPVLAASVKDVVTAEIFKDILHENGIPFTCDENVGDASMRVVFGGGFVAVDIYVAEENLEEAQRIYDEVLNSEPEFSENDFCDEDFEEEV